jgi:hypothetical protein
MVSTILNEMATAFDGIDNASVGFSSGMLNLGLMAKVNPRHYGTIKRGIKTLIKVAETDGIKDVYFKVLGFPNRRVRGRCVPELRYKFAEEIGLLEKTPIEDIIDFTKNIVTDMSKIDSKYIYGTTNKRKWITIFKNDKDWDVFIVSRFTGDIYLPRGNALPNPKKFIGNVRLLSAEYLINYDDILMEPATEKDLFIDELSKQAHALEL